MTWRHEWKHEINISDLIQLRHRLQTVMETDSHAVDGKYEIRSLYFDTPGDKALREKMDGVNQREKFRLRYYNRDTSGIRLEKKSKRNGLGKKQSIGLTEDEARAILENQCRWMVDSGRPLVEELYCKMRFQGLRPKTIVDYTREPFTYAPGNVRITFDRNICTGLSPSQFFHWSCPTVQTDKVETVLMEVKYDAFIPEIIQMCIRENERMQEAFSKYAVCRRFG